MARQYKKEVLQGEHSGLLSVMVYDNNHRSAAFWCTACDIDKSEFKLDAGRFVSYLDVPFEHRVVMTNDYQVSATTLQKLFEDNLEWISRNVHNPWSFDMEIPSLSGPASIIWLFENLDDALLFRLSN